MSHQTTGYYRALLSRDPRFDGTFFTGVTSTGIYCRPICKVRTPKEEHCRFFKTAAAAEQAGFRPCLKCRPELAPGNARIDHSDNLASRAAHLIDAGFLQENSLTELAKQLHVSDRHLRRTFQRYWEVSPIAYAKTQKLLLSKQLLNDTSLPISAIAFAAGFESISRFNAAFKTQYRLSPSALRGRRGDDDQTMILSIGYHKPFDWEALLDFLAARAITGVESIEANSYKRTVSLVRDTKTYTGWIEVTNNPAHAQLYIRMPTTLAPVARTILTKVKHLFDTTCQPHIVSQQLGELAQAHPGLRLPGAFDGFEMAVRAVLEQQITIKAATTIAGKLAATFGTPITTPYPELTTTFPTAAHLENVPLQSLIDCGIYSRRAYTIQQLAAACRQGIDLTPHADITKSLATLQTLPGIGEWTAHYIAMRALAWPDAFMHTDYAIKQALQQSNPAEVLRQAEAWRPWRAYAAMHIWHNHNKKEV